MRSQIDQEKGRILKNHAITTRKESVMKTLVCSYKEAQLYQIPFPHFLEVRSRILVTGDRAYQFFPRISRLPLL